MNVKVELIRKQLALRPFKLLLAYLLRKALVIKKQVIDKNLLRVLARYHMMHDVPRPDNLNLFKLSKR